MAVEIAMMLALLAGGAAAARLLGARGWWTAPLGFLLGLSIYVTTGVILLGLGVPEVPIVALAATAVVPGAWWLVRALRGGGDRPSALAAALSVAATVGLVVLARLSKVVNWHADSLVYANAGRTIARDFFDEASSPYLLVKRLAGVPLMHAPGYYSGEYHVQSIGLVIAAAMLGVIAWVAWEARDRARSAREAAGWIALGLVLLVTVNRFWLHVFYVNAHMALAALLVVIAGAGWLLVRGSAVPRPLLLGTIILAALPAIVMRPEGFVLVALAVAPVAISDRLAPRERLVLVISLAASNAVWAVTVWRLLLDNVGALKSAVPHAAAAVTLAIAAALVLRPFFARRRSALLRIVEVGAWVAVPLVWLLFRAIVDQSVAATAENAFGDGAFWGAGLWVVTALVIAAIALLRVEEGATLRLLATTFFPLALALAVARGGGYRVGPMDSLARMLWHVVPLAVLYVTVALVAGERRGRRAAAADPGADG